MKYVSSSKLYWFCLSLLMIVFGQSLQANEIWFNKVNDVIGSYPYVDPIESNLTGTLYTLDQIEEATDQELAERFAPVFFLNRYETWLPIDAEDFIEEAQLVDSTGTITKSVYDLDGIETLVEATDGTEDEVLMVPENHFKFMSVYDKLRGINNVQLYDDGSTHYVYLSDTPVYSNVIRHKKLPYIDLVYFVFQAYNGCMLFEFKTFEYSVADWGGYTGNHEWCSFGEHQGDWEAVTVRLRKTEAGDGYHLATVQMYSHGDGHPRNNVSANNQASKQRLSFWTETGYERVNVYVSLNTHGMYPQQDKYHDETVVDGALAAFMSVLSNVIDNLTSPGFSIEVIEHIKTIDLTSPNIRPSRPGDFMGEGKFTPNTFRVVFPDYGDIVRLDPTAHGNQVILLENFPLTDVFNGRWGEQDRDNSWVRNPTGNVEHYSDDTIASIGQDAVDTGLVPQKLVVGNGPSSPWTQAKVYFGIYGEISNKRDAAAVAIAYNRARSDIGFDAEANKQSLYVAGLYGKNGELWMGQGTHSNWEHYSSMRPLNTTFGMLFRWKLLDFEMGNLVASGGVPTDIDMNMGDSIMEGHMPVVAAITPLGLGNKSMISLTWRYDSFDQQMIRNRTLADSASADLLPSIDVVVQKELEEDYFATDAPHFFANQNCYGGKRAQLFYGKTTGQVYMATRALVSDLYSSVIGPSWFGVNHEDCKYGSNWDDATHDPSTGFFNRDAGYSNLQVADGLSNITDIAGVFSRLEEDDHRYLVYVAADGLVHGYKVNEVDASQSENPEKTVIESYTFDNWGDVERLDSARSMKHWRIYTAYTKQTTGELCIARNKIFWTGQETASPQCLTLNGAPILADDVSIAVKEDTGLVILQIAYSDRNDLNRNKVVFYEMSSELPETFNGTLTQP